MVNWLDENILKGREQAEYEVTHPPTSTVVDHTLYSCGSLAPKLKRGGGCSDHGFTREKQPWEVSDGAVFLLRYLAESFSDLVENYMQQLSDLA